MRIDIVGAGAIRCENCKEKQMKRMRMMESEGQNESQTNRQTRPADRRVAIRM